jgi:hypothetical protein
MLPCHYKSPFVTKIKKENLILKIPTLGLPEDIYSLDNTY